MQVIINPNSVPIKAWVGLKQPDITYDGSLVPDIEDSAMAQLKNVARLPFLHKNGLAVMPDVHMGVGATIGSVIATRSAVIPSAVGVDIGCGMQAVRLTLSAKDLPDSLAAIRAEIESAIPTGNAMHKSDGVDRFPFGFNNKAISSAWIWRLVNSQGGGISKLLDTANRQIGTLGGGNHFIELCLDQEDRVWLMLHSGSRGIGNKIGRTYIDKAKELCARWHVDLPDNNLAFIPDADPVFDEYIQAVEWAQQYAQSNRDAMLDLAIGALRKHLPTFELADAAVRCHHNYISREHHFGENLWVTRKGAVSARNGELGIIPGSMGQKSYIVRGKGNIQSYCSCSHGAGRAMSRTEARNRFSLTDLIAQTEGVECRKDDPVLDELPSGYKDIDAVMENQRDLVAVVATLKQVLCVKGG